jgi:phosphopantetheine adenylyltransferase
MTDKKTKKHKYVEFHGLEEAAGRKIVVSWGRMNPVTVGHEKLVDKVKSVARKERAMPAIYLSKSQDPKKNPLSYDDKISVAQMAFGNVIKKSNARTIIELMKELDKKFDAVILVVGADRVEEFQKLLSKYNGKEYTFDRIDVVSAGDRDPDADDVTGMSASKMRALASKGDFDAFRKGLPKSLQKDDVAKDVYDMVRGGMKISEEVDLDEAVLTLAQRRKRALTMRKYKNKIAAARKRMAKRLASKEKLKLRAERAARNVLRKKFAGEKGANYDDLSPSEKIIVDKRIEGKKGAVRAIAKRLMPKIIQADREKLKTKDMQESTSTPTKRHHMMFTKEGKIKLDRRFRAFKKENLSSDSELKRMMDQVYAEAVDADSKVYASLEEKADHYGYDTETLLEVFARGLEDYRYELPENQTPQQWAFARVHSFLAGCNDEDLMEASIVNRRFEYLFEDAVPEVPGKQPKNYFKGVSKDDKVARAKQFKRQAEMPDDDPDAYKPAPGDEEAPTKKSKYTKKYDQMFKEESCDCEDECECDDDLNEEVEAVRKKAEETGISYGILKKVYDRGMAAWKTGHRPGTTPQQWALARVNSFVTGGKTRKTADADLAKQIKEDVDLSTFLDINEKFELMEAALEDQIIAAIHKHVSKGVDLGDIANQISQARGVNKTPRELIKMYMSKYAKKNTVSPERARALKKKYGFAVEQSGAGDENTDELVRKYKEDTPGEEPDTISEEQKCDLVGADQMKAFEKFVDRMFDKYDIDFEFTKHFGDRMSDDRNKPCIKMKELADLITKIYKMKGNPLKGKKGSQVVVKDLQSDLNIPFVIDYDEKRDEFVFTAKTIMRKKNFKTPNDVVTYK